MGEREPDMSAAEPVIIAVIPARGGSKGVPGKNLRTVGGLPLVAHAILAGNAASGLAACIVSTDDAEIAAVSREYGGHVPFLRPAELSSDQSPTWAALQHALRWYEAEYNRTVLAVVTLQPTTPLRTAEDIDAAIAMFRAGQPSADSLISVCEAGEHHPLTLYYADGDQLDPLLKGLNPTTRRQDFPPIYWRNGAIYITRRDLLFTLNRVVSERPLAYRMPKLRSANIDAPFDIELAELMLDWNKRSI